MINESSLHDQRGNIIGAEANDHPGENPDSKGCSVTSFCKQTRHLLSTVLLNQKYFPECMLCPGIQGWATLRNKFLKHTITDRIDSHGGSDTAAAPAWGGDETDAFYQCTWQLAAYFYFLSLWMCELIFFFGLVYMSLRCGWHWDSSDRCLEGHYNHSDRDLDRLGKFKGAEVLIILSCLFAPHAVVASRTVSLILNELNYLEARPNKLP